MTARLGKLLSQYSSPLPNAQSLSPTLLQIIQSRNPLLEIKHTMNKQRKASFPLENWYHSPDICVGRWIPSQTQNYSMPLGSFSWGVWRVDLNIGAYRIHDPYGNLVAYRFDILKDVQMTKTRSEDLINFYDLVVDLWLWPTPDGLIQEIQVEDLDELQTLRQSAKISTEDLVLVEKILKDVKSDSQRYSRLVDETIAFAVKSVERATHQ